MPKWPPPPVPYVPAPPPPTFERWVSPYVYESWHVDPYLPLPADWNLPAICSSGPSDVLPLYEARWQHRETDGTYEIFIETPRGSFPADVGESDEIGIRLIKHDRYDEWEALRRFHQGNQYIVRVWPTPWNVVGEDARKQWRLALEEVLRKQYRYRGYPICGIKP